MIHKSSSDKRWKKKSIKTTMAKWKIIKKLDNTWISSLQLAQRFSRFYDSPANTCCFAFSSFFLGSEKQKQNKESKLIRCASRLPFNALALLRYIYRMHFHWTTKYFFMFSFWWTSLYVNSIFSIFITLCLKWINK